MIEKKSQCKCQKSPSREYTISGTNVRGSELYLVCVWTDSHHVDWKLCPSQSAFFLKHLRCHSIPTTQSACLLQNLYLHLLSASFLSLKDWACAWETCKWPVSPPAKLSPSWCFTFGEFFWRIHSSAHSKSRSSKWPASPHLSVFHPCVFLNPITYIAILSSHKVWSYYRYILAPSFQRPGWPNGPERGVFGSLICAASGKGNNMIVYWVKCSFVRWIM